MQPGDWVLAIGNPFGLDHTVSVGVISGLERPFTVANGRSAQVLQTDAAINPAFGRPAAERARRGRRQHPIYTDSQQRGNIGIGFAVPSNTVRELLPQLRTGKITRGRIGVNVRAIPRDAVDELGLKNRDGALVAAVSPNGAAEKAGMEPGDVITSFNGKNVRNSNELVSLVTATRPGGSRCASCATARNGRSTDGRAGPRGRGQPGARRPQQRSAARRSGTHRRLRHHAAERDAANRAAAPARKQQRRRDHRGRAGQRGGARWPERGRRDPSRRPHPRNQSDGRGTRAGPRGIRATAFLRILRDGQETFVPVTKVVCSARDQARVRQPGYSRAAILGIGAVPRARRLQGRCRHDSGHSARQRRAAPTRGRLPERGDAQGTG